MILSDMNEIKRYNARNELDEFLISLSKSESSLRAVERQFDLRKLKTWHDGSIEEYQQKMKDIKDFVDCVSFSKFVNIFHFIHG